MLLTGVYTIFNHRCQESLASYIKRKYAQIFTSRWHISQDLKLLFHSITDYGVYLKLTNKMISSKNLIKLAKRWQKFAAIRRKRILFPKLTDDDIDYCSSSFAFSKGHFSLYTADQKLFIVPLSYLGNEIIRQLPNMSKEPE
ncbi:unnamed protein product [Cuscuta epithymum]|uniref:Uncharacterized protein n=1 Tax=Cuscuta epithymum TaxID=186058 RepID=A0AAV0FXB9_9ASTE|nr:unnamed protein product [Cuscuta epithymum]